MTPQHPLLLYGLALTAVPVVLHLLLRARPKRLPFPALRLIQLRRRQNVQRLQLRHFLLLLARMAAVALIVLAVARLSVPAADYSLTGRDILGGLLVPGCLAALYMGLVRGWRRKLPPHALAHRRSLLRAGLCLVGGLLFALLVAWPYQRRIAASVTQPTITANQNLPVAAVLLFDSSLSMQYRFESKTRLEAAQEIARRHVSGLPYGSKVAVADSASDGPIRFQSDLGGAPARIAAVAVQPASRPLNDRLEAAVELQIEDHERTAADAGSDSNHSSASDGLVREIYLLTDLAASGWRPDQTHRLKAQLARNPYVNVYLVDVGLTPAANVGLTGLLLSDPTLPLGSDLTIRGTVAATGLGDAERTIELYLVNDAGKLVKQGQEAVHIKGDTTAQVEFAVQGLTGPIRQGELRMASSDPLGFDDVRYFTVQVQAPPEVLIVADSRANARFVMEALAPSELVRTGKARYRCTWASPDRLASGTLKKFAAIWLLNVADPKPAGWNALAEYLDQGGGVAIALGGRVNQPAYLSPAALAILPGKLLASLKFNPPEFLDLNELTHPIFKRFADWGVADLNTVEIHRYWRVAPEPDGSVVARYTDRRSGPAILERLRGKGRTIVFTSSLGRQGWNDLPAAGWQFLALIDQIMKHLSQASEAELNVQAGAEVRVLLDANLPGRRFLLRKPGKQQIPISAPAGAPEIVVRETDQLGNYQVIGADDSPFVRGFSVNPDPNESRLARLTADNLDEFLGKGRYSLATSIEGLERKVQEGRVGREIAASLVWLLVLVFLFEQLIATRFYEAPAPHPTR